MKKLPFCTVDVFTRKPFTGNPLAIVQEADGLSTQQMQTLAREFNLAETIFVQTPDNSENTAKVRIFFPTDEIPFAGHPTIGCAIYLAEQLQSDDGDFDTEIKLEEVAGLVPVEVSRRGGKVSAQFTAPVNPYPTSKIDLASDINLDVKTAATTLGLSETDIDFNDSQPMSHAGGPTFLFIPVNSREALSKARAIEPQCNQLTTAYGGVGLYVYYLHPTKNEVEARMFAPEAGISEDPATGSASALLASQLKADGKLLDGTNSFVLRQGYDMGRPSDLMLEIDFDSGEILAVRVAGSSVAISSGHIRIPD